MAGPISWSPLNLQVMPLRSTRGVPSAMPGTHQALRRCHFPLCAVYTTSPRPGEAGSYSSHLQLWILVLEELGVGSLKRCGFSLHWPRAIHTAGSPHWAGSREVGAAPALPHPDTGLCLLLRLLLAPVLARTAVWLRAWQGACCPPPPLGSASWPVTCHMPHL